MHVHDLLSGHTVDEQIWDLVDQKWAAQRAVQDRQAQHKAVEAILAEAVLKAKFGREGATVEKAEAKAEESVARMATQLVFGRVLARTKARQRRGKPEVKVLYLRSLPDVEEEDGKPILPPTKKPVQLAMFAL